MILGYYQLKISGYRDRYLYILAPNEERIKDLMRQYRRTHYGNYRGYHMLALRKIIKNRFETIIII